MRTAVATLAALLAFSIVAPPAAGAARAGATTDADWERALAGNGTGWCGGDGIFSVPLGAGRTLWLFGDTFLGRIADGRRDRCILVNNTIAVTGTAAGGAIRPRFFWGRDGARPAAYFPPLTPGRYFWPLHGIVRGGTLYVFLMEIEGTGMGEAFAFRLAGNALAVIDRPDRDPLLWKPRLLRLPHGRATDDDSILWGTALLPAGNGVHVYGYRERKEKETGRVARELVRAVVPRRLESFAGWRIDLTPLADEIAVEHSVSRLPGGRLLLCHTRGLHDPTAITRIARRPGAPFGPPAPLFTPPLPEGRRGFAYAAKLHPHLADRRGELLTWVVNSLDFMELFSDASLYTPRADRVRVR